MEKLTQIKQNKQILLKRIDYKFRDYKLFEQALVHASTQNFYSYERLEFLGDRVLGLIIAELLYKEFPNESEGSLSKRFTYLISRPVLVLVSKELNLSNVISFVGSNVLVESVLADVCEALIAAIYLDGGLCATRNFLIKYWKKYFGIDSKPPEDPKTTLQEWSQSRYREVPFYKIISQSGPSHLPIFLVEVSVLSFGGKARSTGSSKNKAEHKAAYAFLKKYKICKEFYK